MLSSPVIESAPAQGFGLSDTSALYGWRERGDRPPSHLRPHPLAYTGEGPGVREELLSRLLLDEEESLNRLYAVVSQVGLHILVFDEKGRIVGRYGKSRKCDHQAYHVDRTFNRLSAENTKQTQYRTTRRKTEIDAVEGTTQVSLGSHDGMIAIDRSLSIFPRIPSVSRLAAPICDTEGGLLGFLDVSPATPDLTGASSALAHTLMRTTARAVEERSFRKRYCREWIIALAPPNGGDHGMLLAVDGQHRIVGADRRARSALSPSGVHLGNRPALWALFEKDAALFRSRNIGDIHAALISVSGGQMWSSIVTPPAPGALHQHSPEYTTLHSRPRLDSIGLSHRSALPVSSVGGLTPRALQRIREYIDEHLEKNIELGTLADIAGLSKWHFARAFKQSVGVPPHFFLIRRRLERAQELLAETDFSLAQIALKIGFSDQSHFSRRFRLLIGVTPRSFRWSKR